MRTVFLGTPHFAVPTLQRMLAAGHVVVEVYTQPDRPKGRGGELAQSPVKQAALAAGLTVAQPERIRKPEFVEHLRSLNSEVMVVVGYGQIIPQSIIDLPRFGIVNVHASLLPKYRGAAPIQWAIANGDTTTGVTTMNINAGLDTGDMLLKATTPIGADETALQLGPRLADLGAELLVDTLRGLENGSVKADPQNDAEATLAPILTKEDGLIDWSMPAQSIYNRLRGFSPWPGTYSHFRGQRLHILQAKPAIHIESGPPGKLLLADKRLLVACAPGTALELIEVQLEGRKKISADAFRNGQRLTGEHILGDMKN